MTARQVNCWDGGAGSPLAGGVRECCGGCRLLGPRWGPWAQIWGARGEGLLGRASGGGQALERSAPGRIEQRGESWSGVGRWAMVHFIGIMVPAGLRLRYRRGGEEMSPWRVRLEWSRQVSSQILETRTVRICREAGNWELWTDHKEQAWSGCLSWRLVCCLS